MTIRYPLIEARLTRTAWCATPTIVRSIWNAVRRHGKDVGIDSVGMESPQRQRPQTMRARLSSSIGIGGGRVVTMDPTEPGTVAVIPVHGVIGKYLSATEMECGGGYDLQFLENCLLSAAADPMISDIVLHIHSPGGVVTGVAEISQLVAQINQVKPVWSYTDSEMCSAAYWIGCSGSGVFTSDMASVGSIGVYMAWIDDSKAMEAEGEDLILIKDGDFKATTLPGQLSEEARALIQNEVLAIGSAFRGHVTSCRMAASEQVVERSSMEGQTFLGRDAIGVGLVDATFRSLNDLLTNILN